MERGQFTFYRSFWDAVRGLPKRDRLPILEAIIGYALDETEPVGLSQSQGAFFLLCRPTLDASRKRAAGGKNGGSLAQANRKALTSLPQACGKPVAREIEGEKEKKKENEIENETEGEVDKGQAPRHEKTFFDNFWDAYPVKIGYEKAAAVWDLMKPTEEEYWRIMDGLTLWKNACRWAEKGGRFIPRAARFLREQHYLDPPRDEIPKGATGVLGAAEIEAIERIMRQ